MIVDDNIILRTSDYIDRLHGIGKIPVNLPTHTVLEHSHFPDHGYVQITNRTRKARRYLRAMVVVLEPGLDT
jgi:hypothetical protein